MSTITTHILDTTRGKPAEGVNVILYQQQREWLEIGRGITNSDGRIRDLLAKETVLPTGVYKLRFETGAYYELLKVATFYPFVEITFAMTTGEHYHVPLLLNPFGYSTYRGS
ncbi:MULTISPECIES: hydroxyisourate hydrolase [unclassified Spirosoma]|uniref:hydroxyisourate hydrolase n=1 Tax=unclassified Spirosoma TaxID=2621999 RepID=UPI000969DB97|nr:MULTISPECIES: hydroxyisourate hydrolase [unclassified Spirosoma]MBN8825596.1 hydroxyisourate hydrolase [Spirosoma sp.]OJW71699.1 MAG: hydroxyisourate hydrolase [Spirosoma sp. 48-14]